MKKAELVALFINKYGVYPPKSFSYVDLIRLRSMLEKHGKLKRKAIEETPVFNPPPFKPFKIEDE